MTDLKAVGHHEPHPVSLLEVGDFLAALGDDPCPVSAQDHGKVVCAHVGVISEIRNLSRYIIKAILYLLE